MSRRAEGSQHHHEHRPDSSWFRLVQIQVQVQVQLLGPSYLAQGRKGRSNIRCQLLSPSCPADGAPASRYSLNHHLNNQPPGCKFSHGVHRPSHRPSPVSLWLPAPSGSISRTTTTEYHRIYHYYSYLIYPGKSDGRPKRDEKRPDAKRRHPPGRLTKQKSHGDKLLLTWGLGKIATRKRLGVFP